MSGRQPIARFFAVLLALAGGTAGAQAAASSSWPVGTSLGGIGLTAPEGAECLVFPTGSSSLITGADTFIGLPSVYGDGGLTYTPADSSKPTIIYVGAAHLKFATPSSGRVMFDFYYAQVPITQPTPPAPLVTFSDFATVTTGSPATLKLRVTFAVDGCKATLHAIYHQP